MCDWRIEGFRGMQGGDWMFDTLDEDMRGWDIYNILYFCDEYYQTGKFKWFKVYYYKTRGEREYNDPHTEFLIDLESGVEMRIRTKDDKMFIVYFEENGKRKIIDCNKKEEGV